jgi:hypothetical protein
MPALVAQRLGQRLANGDAGVFGGVVLVDMQVAHRLHGQSISEWRESCSSI